jgi:hypothetical protein
MFSHLAPQRDTAGQGSQNAQLQAGVPTVGNASNSTATMCSDGARFTISYPPTFNPEKSNWFSWCPQVERFLTRVNLDPKILIAEHCDAFTDNQHATTGRKGAYGERSCHHVELHAILKHRGHPSEHHVRI